MQLTPGTSIGSYEITGQLGAGGMGEVYRARDPKLERDVAIKVLPPDFASDPARLARFEREAKALAALNHPNIATVHGFEQDGSTHFLVMELVEGEDLAERLKRGALAVEEAIPLFVQIAEGLEAAHEKGIIHRDLKPANIMVSDNGRAKILDFGLAKAIEPTSSQVDLSNSPTMTAATMLGAILGTAAYMSPEQASGKAIDKRSDIWSFGVCLYEALTGERAFFADDAPNTLAAVLRDDVDLSRLPAETPRAVRRLLERCLVRDRNQRLRDVGDATLELKLQPDEDISTSGSGSASRSRVQLSLVAIAAAIAGALAVAVLGGIGAPAENPSSLVRSSLRLPEGLRIDLSEKAPLAISKDGSTVVYSATDGSTKALYRRRLDEFESTRIPGSEDGRQPFFSPDGAWVGFFAGNKLKKVSLAGGSPTELATLADSYGHSWGPDGKMVVQSIETGLLTIDENGGELEPLSSTHDDGAFFHGWPSHTPDGGLLYGRWGYDKTLMLWPPGGEAIPLAVRDGTSGVVTANGYLLYLATETGRGVNAVALDSSTGRLEGTAVNVLPDVYYTAADSGVATFSVSDSGTLIFLEDQTDTLQLAWATSSGDTTPIEIETPDLAEPRLSFDGKRVLASSDQERSIWLIDLERGSAEQLFEEEARRSSQNAIWSPDGSITFGSNRSGDWELYRIDPRESDTAEVLLELRGFESPRSWSPDGSTLLIVRIPIKPDTSSFDNIFDIWAVQWSNSTPQAEPLFATSASEVDAVFSPDGSLIAYVSDESGTFEVYVSSFPPGYETPVSRGGGKEPRWSPDGQTLYFRHNDRFLASTLVDRKQLRFATPELLFEQPFLSRSLQTYAANYDISKDGERFLFVSNLAAREIQVVQNWFSELERLAPRER